MSIEFDNLQIEITQDDIAGLYKDSKSGLKTSVYENVKNYSERFDEIINSLNKYDALISYDEVDATDVAICIKEMVKMNYEMMINSQKMAIFAGKSEYADKVLKICENQEYMAYVTEAMYSLCRALKSAFLYDRLIKRAELKKIDQQLLFDSKNLVKKFAKGVLLISAGLQFDIISCMKNYLSYELTCFTTLDEIAKRVKNVFNEDKVNFCEIVKISQSDNIYTLRVSSEKTGEHFLVGDPNVFDWKDTTRIFLAGDSIFNIGYNFGAQAQYSDRNKMH